MHKSFVRGVCGFSMSVVLAPGEQRVVGAAAADSASMATGISAAIALSPTHRYTVTNDGTCE